MPEVARAAGVGIGTVYRRFPTRQTLARYLRHVGQVLCGDWRRFVDLAFAGPRPRTDS
ncbi:helix-turn-helix domain containing protein [Actinacidiphila oryziradicis]|jgi:AcrR family transcriptional regulator|uniref:helix-turn-helix domain containing protein n=1 Tax=Actinacidiphila oryziradicis TaxID=2571141 RepID=UPI0023F1D4D4|nr:helix-turn-helix domain containing protein [Actinacidiphila oryziradicis]MCW2870284.1 hypothetical protein [Actinacidiphila oryziradicis]